MLLIFAECRGQLLSDSSSVIRVYKLGEVLISAKADRSSVSSEDMRRFNTTDVSSSIRILPSVVLGSSGSRNESTVYIGGFDIRSIPVFIDGIPVYVPYDGYVDLARFMTSDVSKIDVSRGFSPVSFGPNSIGGAINIISMKPLNRFEFAAKAGIFSGQGYQTVVNTGSNFGKVWIQGGFSALSRSFYRLPSSFDTSARETDRLRDNSSSEDIKFSIKAGYTPDDGDEHTLNYVIAHGEKGNPVYLGDDRNTRLRYWKWPNWDKQSIYYISRTSFGTRYVLKARAYFDNFSNILSSFDDETYSSQAGRSSFNSYYYDNTFGSIVEFSSDLSGANNLLLSAQIKNDYHRERTNSDPYSRFSDNTLSIGIDDVHKAGDGLKIISGLSFNSRKSLNASSYNDEVKSFDNFPGDRSNSMNAQAAGEIVLSDKADINLSLAYKNRFATMKERFSYRLGTGIPNPFLRPENALKLDISSSIRIIDGLFIEPELFMSRLFNTIQLVSNVQDDLSQMQNTGNSRFGGFNLNTEYKPASFLKFDLAYSYIRMKNLSNPEIIFTSVPKNKLFLSAEAILMNKLSINVFSDYNSGSYSASDGSRFSPGFFLLNLSMRFRISETFSTETGINNILDRQYSIEEGYPEPGRNFFLSVNFDMKMIRK